LRFGLSVRFCSIACRWPQLVYGKKNVLKKVKRGRIEILSTSNEDFELSKTRIVY